MFKRKGLTEDLLQGEKYVYDVINKLNSAREKVYTLKVRWASGEDNSLIFSLFQRLAEIQWMYNEATKQMAEKQLELSKAFKRIFVEEKLLEDSRKDLQSALLKFAKLQKQIDNANKKGDHAKATSLESEFTAQGTVCDNLTSSVESKIHKLELYKTSQLKKALVYQAEGVLTLAGHCQQLYASQMRLIDILPESPIDVGQKKEGVEHRMANVVSKVSDLLDIHPPPSGGVDIKSNSFVNSGNTSVSRTSSNNSEITEPGQPLKCHKSAETVNIVDLPPRLSMQHRTVHQSSSTNNSVRPEVNYTQGMYCEIVIPERGRGDPAIHESDRIPMRRSQSGSSPKKHSNLPRENRRSEVIEISHVLDEELADFISDPETTSIRYSSSEDLGLADETESTGYASLTVLPTSSRTTSPVSPDFSDSVEYAKPADYVPLGFNVRHQQRRPKKGLTPSPPIPEGKRVSTYESIEGILKEKQKQQQKGETERQWTVSPSSLDENRSEDNSQQQPAGGIDDPIYSRPFDSISGANPLKVTASISKTKHAGDQGEDSREQQPAAGINEPIYSRPFDSISGANPLKVTKSNVAIRPNRRSLGDKQEKAAKFIHQTNVPARDKISQPRDLSYSPESSSSVSPDDSTRKFVATKGRSHSAKNPWRLRDSNSTVKLPRPSPAPLNKNKSTTDIHDGSQSGGKLPKFFIELEKNLTKKPQTSTELNCSPEPEWRAAIGRVSSEGAASMSPFGISLKPAAVRKRKTGQPQLINGNELKPIAVTESK